MNVAATNSIFVPFLRRVGVNFNAKARRREEGRREVDSIFQSLPALLIRIDHVTGDYQIIWIADWVKDGKTVKTIAYAVRGISPGDKFGGLDAPGIKNLQKVLVAAESQPTTKPSADKKK